MLQFVAINSLFFIIILKKFLRSQIVTSNRIMIMKEKEEISETIREVSEGHTHLTIVIAHRLSTIMHADKIFVLEKGRIVENGSHTELLDNKGLYYAMWRQQVGEKDSIEIE